MVKQLFSFEDANRELGKRPLQSVKLTLGSGVIARWKRDGYFRFIRAQLGGIHSLQFLCATQNGGCIYLFMMPSKDLLGRVTNMFGYLIEKNKMVPLMQCSTIVESEGVLRELVDGIRVSGNPQACPLFS